MFGDVWTKTLWDQRRALLGWLIGFGVVSLIYGSFYPVITTPEYEQVIDALPSALIDAFGWDEFASAYGYMGSTVYGLLGPVLAIVMAIGLGSRAIAGSEEDGSLEMLIAYPVSRTKVVAQKSAALAVSTLLAGLVVFAVVAVLGVVIELDIPIANIAAASFDLALLALLFGVLAILVGSIRGRRGLAIGVTTVLVVIAFLANGLLPQVEGLAWTQNLSPFHWADATATLRDGIAVTQTALLAGVSVVLIAAAAVVFNRRDVMV